MFNTKLIISIKCDYKVSNFHFLNSGNAKLNYIFYFYSYEYILFWRLKFNCKFMISIRIWNLLSIFNFLEYITKQYWA